MIPGSGRDYYEPGRGLTSACYASTTSGLITYITTGDATGGSIRTRSAGPAGHPLMLDPPRMTAGTLLPAATGTPEQLGTPTRTEQMICI